MEGEFGQWHNLVLKKRASKRLMMCNPSAIQVTCFLSPFSLRNHPPPRPSPPLHTHLAVSLVEAGVVHADAKIEGVPQV